MNISALHIGQKVRHPQYGVGTVKTIAEHTADIHFDDNTKRTVAPDTSGLEPAEPHAAVSGLDVPLSQLIDQTRQRRRPRTGSWKSRTPWSNNSARAGMCSGEPARDASRRCRAAGAGEVPLETFFHKIVMVRNNLRVLEQKIPTPTKNSATAKKSRCSNISPRKALRLHDHVQHPVQNQGRPVWVSHDPAPLWFFAKNYSKSGDKSKDNAGSTMGMMPYPN